MVAASLAGYYFLGFMGNWACGAALSGLPPRIYAICGCNGKSGTMLMARGEIYKIAFANDSLGSAHTLRSSLLLAWWPWMRIAV